MATGEASQLFLDACGGGCKTFRIEVLSTAKAAERLGMNVQKFHRLAARYGITPALKAEGQTGAMFWLDSDVERLRAELAEAEAS
jgi:hypothetical protein